MSRPHGNIDVLQLSVNGVNVDLGALSGPTPPWPSKNLLLLQDRKPYGTPGGASSAGIQTRVLNSVPFNDITGASLVANQVSLPAGTYRIWATVPFNGGGRLSQGGWWNVTDGVLVAHGTSTYNEYGGNVHSIVFGQFTITTTKTFELRQYCSFAVLVNGLGKECTATFPGGTEIYSQVMIAKM